jgi:hypothetical protein
MYERSDENIEATLRNGPFEEIERVSDLASSYSRSTGEAAHRGDETTMVVSLKQLRLCVLHMIQVYKNFMERGDDGHPG